MKSITYLLAFGILCQLAVLSSCNKDEAAVNPIVATWILFSDTEVDCDDPLDNHSETYTCTSTDCAKVTFTSDGKYKAEYTESGDTEITNGTYTISGNKITTCETGGTCDDAVTYSISGGTMTITSTDDSSGCAETIIFKK